MFPGYPIGSITNGVHSTTWTAPPFAALYDRYIPDWRRDSFSLRYALGVPVTAIQEAHRRAKAQLVRTVHARTAAQFERAFHDRVRPPSDRLQATHAPAA
jgi:starch phosphorylase